MIYREAGQFKTSYVTDAQIFPIAQDRIGIAEMASQSGCSRIHFRQG